MLLYTIVYKSFETDFAVFGFIVTFECLVYLSAMQVGKIDASCLVPG